MAAEHSGCRLPPGWHSEDEDASRAAQREEAWGRRSRPRREGSLWEAGCKKGFLGKTGRLLLTEGVLSLRNGNAAENSHQQKAPCQGLEP